MSLRSTMASKTKQVRDSYDDLKSEINQQGFKSSWEIDINEWKKMDRSWIKKNRKHDIQI